MLQGPGENAGVLDLGDGEAVAFKVESHNHPSAVEPFQGAATGVGGILRDIVAMGARPVALLDGLYFGDPGWMFRRAVAGIGPYGNCVGVPTVGGETRFDEAYRDNCLVNAMCVGLLPTERVLRAKARTAGHAVVLYGATTGRDGIGGASVLASAELGEDDPDKRPSVQIGDPFTGKKLIEASLELVERGLVESLQDCGAAGLASALSEMASETGIDVHLDRVPLREPDLEPWEIMISESQERMVAVVRRDFVAAVEEVCARWELAFASIGEVTDTGELRAFHDDEVVGAIPAALLTDECPRYEVEREAHEVDAELAAAQLALRAERREQGVDLPPVRPPRRLAHGAPPGPRRGGAPAAAVAPRARRLAPGPAARRARPVPRRPQAVLGAALNVACAGGEPLALTDCLNFGNPEKPEIGWELERRSRRSRRRPGRSGSRSSPATSRSTTRRTVGRSRRRPSSAASGSSRTSAACRAAGSEGDVILAAGAPRASRRGRARPLRGARRAAALARARRRRRRPRGRRSPRPRSGAASAPEVDVPDGARVLVACAPEQVGALGAQFEEIGVVGGTTLLGTPLDELRAAWEAATDVRRLRHPLARTRRRAHRVLRALRAPAPRPGVGRHRRLRPRPADRRSATWASSRRSSPRRSCAASAASSRSATRATRRPARRTGRTRSRSCTTAARERSRSGTTATSRTPPSSAKSSPRRASASTRRPTAR